MTATTTQSLRHELDRYDSPHWLLTHTLQYVRVQGTVFDPCVGSGLHASLLKESPHVNQVITNDINPIVDADYHYNAAEGRIWKSLAGDIDWVITNPPFNQAFDIAVNALNSSRIGIILFLRHSFDEPTNDRADWLNRNPTSLRLVYPRFKWRKDKASKNWQTDSTTVDAYVWFNHKSPVNAQYGVISVPKTHINGFHDNPGNAPTKEEMSRWLRWATDETKRCYLLG